MGRIKRGLDYFPMSTSFMHDRMVRRIMRREGDSAFATLVETLSYIYAGKGRSEERRVGKECTG